jgi:predicted  nucleic acid-binding Zn-ribbon protein
MEPTYVALLELQELDQEMARAEEAMRAFDPQLSEINNPLTSLEKELETTRSRLVELRAQAIKLEKAAETKRDRLRTYQARMDKVRNERERTAVHLEMDLIHKAADADDAETLQVMDQVTRTDVKQEDLEKQLQKMREEAEPRREEVERARKEAETALQIMRDKRENLATRLDPASRRLYDRVRQGKSNVALAQMTEEGACGHCFNVLPLQEQSEVRRGQTLHRCEACGVILYAA